MKVTATLAITLALFIALNSCNAAESRPSRPADLRSKRHIVQKRLTAEDVLGDMYTGSELINSCRESKCFLCHASYSITRKTMVIFLFVIAA